jgi:hypothetical protein
MPNLQESQFGAVRCVFHVDTGSITVLCRCQNSKIGVLATLFFLSSPAFDRDDRYNPCHQLSNELVH